MHLAPASVQKCSAMRSPGLAAIEPSVGWRNDQQFQLYEFVVLFRVARQFATIQNKTANAISGVGEAAAIVPSNAQTAAIVDF
jgi:hypothetical protein